MSSGLDPNLDMNYHDSIEAATLSIALIGPDEDKRSAIANALAKWPGAEIREFPTYPPAVDDVIGLLKLAFNVVIVDLDSSADYALQLVESICARDSATVMVYSSAADPEQVERSRRAGAREFLFAPFDQGKVVEALVRIAALTRAGSRLIQGPGGRQFVFLGAKGGSGTTTIACNYAIALAQTSKKRTLLIDMGLPLGDAALNLGIVPEHSTEDALQAGDNLDASLLESLVASHESGLYVLAAPSRIPETSPTGAAVDQLMKVARAAFDFAIVDAGSRVDLMNTSLFSEASTTYMITQAGISELRNADRLISLYFGEGKQKPEIVVNRFDSSVSRVTEDQVTKALGAPARWKIPDDYDATRQMQNADALRSNAGSAFSRLIVEMASSVTGCPIPEEFEKAFGFTGSHTEAAVQMSAGDMGQSPMGGPEMPPPNPHDGNMEPTEPSSAPFTAGGLPNVIWRTPNPIVYGTALSETQLNATASVRGAFVYTPGPGYVLPAGTHTLWVTFTADHGPMVQSAVSITVEKATPRITWLAPRSIVFSVALGDDQLNASASVAGKLDYTPKPGIKLEPGEHSLSVAFTPADNKNYNVAKAQVPITIDPLTPEITWATPEKIPCGGALTAKHLNAKASVAGTFVYSPTAGEVMEPGEHMLTVFFTPADGTHYLPAQGTVNVTVMKAPPRLTWPVPDPIVYGAPLSTAQLNATASEDGGFIYSPGMGAVLAVGQHTPSVTFTPRDNPDFEAMQAAVPLTVVMARPALTWTKPEPISSGTPLSTSELNANSPVPGTFAYKPAMGEVLPAGTHTLAVTFTPVDTINYEPAKATVTVTVSELSRVEIHWPAPASIPYGTALSEAQLNATSSVPGNFAYGPGAGNVLAPGKHTLTALFTPKDEKRYATTSATVTLRVEPVPDIASILVTATQAPGELDEIDDQPGTAVNAREFERAGSIPMERDVLVMKNAPANQETAQAQNTESAADTNAKAEAAPAPVVPAVIPIAIANNPAASPEAHLPSPGKPDKPRETRSYKGVIYEKGEDGQWHRQQK